MVFPKHYKLTVHEQSFSQDDVLIFIEEDGLQPGDIIEVYHPDGEYSRLLVQIKHLQNPSIKPKAGHISINSSLASAFQLRQYKDVIVNHISHVDDAVTLDVLELVFKDQFVTRSDTWRLHRSLIGSCVYYCNKVTFTSMRVHVNEMWMKGSKVACGVVGESTKIVCRSLTAKVHIFVQMSSEMWEFDHSGDLYFEKGIMGFLQDLFSRWKENSCNHTVVIVLFSRTYYKATSINEFPEDMQKKVIYSTDGQYYQDFYKIIKQSEKQDDLQNIIILMKSSFHEYAKYVNCQQPLANDRLSNNRDNSSKCIGVNSRADKGNLLEAINMSLNVFETLYIDCNLEETNCIALVITPSTGVFEVSEELTLLTKNRLIENGVRVDLVCLAEQPLHAVPLLKFPSKNGKDVIYDVPQWLNLSYYSKAQTQSSLFVPRMQVPPRPQQEVILERSTPANSGVIDYEEFDTEVFNYATRTKGTSLSRVINRPSNLPERMNSTHSSPEVSKSVTNPSVVKKLSLNEDANNMFMMRSISEDQGKRALCQSYDDLKFTMGNEKDTANESKKNTLNPFKAKHMANAITLFKHRWLDIMTASVKTQDAFHRGVMNSEVDLSSTKGPSPDADTACIPTVARKTSFVGSLLSQSLNTTDSNHTFTKDEFSDDKTSTSDNRSVKSVYKPEETLATMLTKVDWKSLCMPACLPLTINYFPDEKTLRQNYDEYIYTMIMEEEEVLNVEKEQQEPQKDSKGTRFHRKSMSSEEKFMEMISQRIGQGFQFVTKPDVKKILKLENAFCQSMEFDPDRDYVLSMGNIIHHLKLANTEVHVNRYSLREPYVAKQRTYRYNLWAHNLHNYSLAQTEFSLELASKYNWNNLDRYICETGFNQFNEQMKYWRTRFLLLPIRSSPFSTSPPVYDSMKQIESFLKFLEGMNKIRRGSVKRQLFGCRKRSPKVNNGNVDRLRTNERRSATPERLAESRENSLHGEKKNSPLRVDSLEQKELADSPMTPRPSSFTGAIPDNMPPEHCLSITSSCQEIIKLMLDPGCGLHFLPRQDELNVHTFISAEAVAWMMRSIDGCPTKDDAVNLGQRLLEEKCIVHASESVCQSFIDGFFLYYIKEEKREEETEKRRFWFGGSKKSEEELLKSYNIQWLEAAVWRDDSESWVAPFLRPEVPDVNLVVNLVAKAHGTANTVNDTSNFLFNSVPLYKSMEYNLEADQKSKRPEWCTLFYHGNYYPNKCAYAVELNWMVATCSIIADLVQKWSHRGSSWHVHVVPAPMCIFPVNNNPRCFRNPLRGAPFIRLQLESLLKPGQSHIFEDYEPSTWSSRMFLFHEAILRRFDFLRDITRNSHESVFHSQKAPKVYQYIHSSGSIFIKINNIFMKDQTRKLNNDLDIVDSPFRKNRRPSKKPEDDRMNFESWEDKQFKESYGFFWVYNWALSKKWRTQYTGDVPMAKKFVNDFAAFCANKGGQLERFWHEAYDSLNYPVSEWCGCTALCGSLRETTELNGTSMKSDKE